MDLRQLNKYKDKMKLEKLFVSILAAAALFVGCKETGEDSELPSLSVNPTEISVDKAGGSQTFTVKSNRDWTVKADADWLAVNPTYGSASKKDATVTVTALQNTGFNRSGTVTVSTDFDYKTITVTQPGDKGEDTTNKPTGSGTQADPYNPAGVVAYVKTLAADEESPSVVWIKGIVSEVKMTFEASGTYGNANFYITGDGSNDLDNRFYCFQTLYLGNKKWTSGNPDVKVGDEVIVCGKVVNYKGDTPETVKSGASYIYSLNGQTEGQSGGDDYQNAEAKTVALFIAAADNNKYYKLTGKVSSFNSSYCSFDLTDESGAIYVYSVANKDEWASKIKNGGTVTLAGKYLYYEKTQKHEVVDAYILSFEEGQGGGDDYQNAEAKTVAEFIAAADKNTYYKLTGEVSGFNASYCSFDLTDASGKIYVYSVANKDEWSSKIKNGGTVTLAGKYDYYASKEQHEVVNAYILSFVEGQGGTVQEVSVAGAIAAEKDAELKVGPALVVAAASAGFLIEQDGARLYVYGSNTVAVGDNVTVTATRGEYGGVAQLTGVTDVTVNSKGNTVSYPTAKDITSSFDSYSSDTREYVTFKGTLNISGNYFNLNVEGATAVTGALVKPNEDLSSLNGKVVTVTGYFLYFASNGKYLYVIATEIKGEGGETPPGPGGDDYTSNVTWTLGTNAYDDVAATVNGVANVKTLKLGTSKAAGSATVVIPKGTKSVSFYGVSWKGNATSVVVQMGGSDIYTQALAANDGASGSGPYTMTVTESDHYTMTLPSQLTEDVTVTVTTAAGGKTRVILFGIKAQ